MKKKSFVLILLLLKGLFIFAQFTLKGVIKNSQAKCIYLKHTNKNMIWVKDSSTIIDSKFSFKGDVNVYTQLALIYLDSNEQKTWARIPLENKEININIDADSFSTFEVIGSNSWSEYQNLNKIINSLYERRFFLDSLLDSKISKRDSLNYKYEIFQVCRQLSNKILTYVKNNRGSNISPLIIWENTAVLGFKKLSLAFSYLTETQRKSQYGQFLFKDISYRDSILIKKIPDFYYTDLTNVTQSNKHLKNKKFLLFEFWGTWCFPCRKEHPQLVTLFLKYGQKFNILSIAAKEDDINEWRSAIKKDVMSKWSNALSENVFLKKSNTKLSKYFGVKVYPTLILVGVDNNIIKYQISLDELEAFLKNN